MTAQEAGEWIAHDGGECPVSPDTRVDVRFRDGIETPRCMAGNWSSGGADWWKHAFDYEALNHAADPHGSDIIAYRIIQP